jgi:hypothetical protein
MSKTLQSIAWLTALTITTAAHAQQSSSYETGADGVTYHVTRQVVPRSIPTTEIQTREQK